MVDELAPPRKSVELEDPGAKELGALPYHVREYITKHVCRRSVQR
jgi:hypothetical protein